MKSHLLSTFKVKEIEPVFDVNADLKDHIYERSRIAICGPTGSGKTTLLMREFLFNNDKPKFEYSKLYIASSTMNADKEYISLQKKMRASIEWFETFESFVENIQRILKDIVQYRKDCKREKFPFKSPIIIIDDMASYLHDNTDLNNLVSKSRHYCTIIFLTQSYSALSTFIRKQLNIVFITQMSDSEFSQWGKELVTDMKSARNIVQSLHNHEWLQIHDKRIQPVLFKPSPVQKQQQGSDSDTD